MWPKTPSSLLLPWLFHPVELRDHYFIHVLVSPYSQLWMIIRKFVALCFHLLNPTVSFISYKCSRRPTFRKTKSNMDFYRIQILKYTHSHWFSWSQSYYSIVKWNFNLSILHVWGRLWITNMKPISYYIPTKNVSTIRALMRVHEAKISNYQ